MIIEISKPAACTAITVSNEPNFVLSFPLKAVFNAIAIPAMTGNINYAILLILNFFVRVFIYIPSC